MLLSLPVLEWSRFLLSSSLDKESIAQTLKDLIEREYTLYVQLKHPYKSVLRIFYSPSSSTYIITKYRTKLRWEYSKIQVIDWKYVFTERNTWNMYRLTKNWIIKKYKE